MAFSRQLLLTFLWLAGVSAAAAAETGAVKIGVLAKRGAEQARVQWQATADYLSSKVDGHRFEIVPLDFDAIGVAVAAGRVDFVLANSAIYVDLEMRHGVSRIATLRNAGNGSGYTEFGGVIFTRSDRGDLVSLTSLEGRRFAAVDETSLGGFLMAWRELAAIGLDPHADMRLTFAGTHDQVVRQVLDGSVDAGTVRTDTLERMAAEGAIDLARIKVLNPQTHPSFEYRISTRLYPEWPFAKLQGTSDELSHAVATALLAMPCECGAAVQGSVTGWTIPRNYQPVHELMRELHVGPYAEFGKITAEALLRQYWRWLAAVAALVVLMALAILYVSALNRRLQHTERNLREVRDHLAERVRERTADLEAARARLEKISRAWNEAFDAIADPIFIHDAQLCIVQANPAYCERAGASLDALRGKRYYDHFPRLGRPLPACLDFPERLSTNGNELVLDTGEIYISRSFGIRGADGTVSQAIHILEDVTAERRADQSRRLLSRAVEQAGDGILLLDQDHRVSYCNPALARLLGDEHGQSWRPASLDDLLCRGVEAHRETLDGLFAGPTHGAIRAAELELMSTAGRPRSVYLTVSVVQGEHGGSAGHIVTVVDLSRLKQAQAQLLHRTALEALVAGLASRFVAVDGDQWDAVLGEALAKLGEFAGADRVYLFRYDEAADTISNTHEWCAEDVAAQHKALQGLPLGDYPWLKSKLQDNECVAVDDVAALPLEADAERKTLTRLDVVSLLLAPVSFGGRFAGFVGFDFVQRPRQWVEADVRLLRVAAQLIGSALGRVLATARVRESEASLAAAQRIAHLGNWDWNIVSNDLTWSDEIFRIFGLRPQQFGATYDAFLEGVHPDDRQHVIDSVNRAVAGEQDYEIDHRIVLPDGEVRTVHEKGDVMRSADGQPLRMIGTVQDVTDARRGERELRRVNRALRTISRCNMLLVHARTEQALTQAICETLVESGGYRFAWVGLAQGDERKSVVPIARAGHEAGFLDTLDVTWGGGPEAEVPTGIAMRTRKRFIERDIASSRAAEAWRTAALERGYASVIALPLMSQDELYGAITIDAAEPDAFDTSEVSLLEELAADLAFGIRSLRGDQERARAETALLNTEQRYEELYESAPNAYLSVDARSGRLLQFNQALCDMLDYAREDLMDMKVFDLYAPGEQGRGRAQAVFERFQRGEHVRDEEMQMRRRGGEAVWVSVSVDPVANEAGEIVESRSMVIDISGRKQAEAERMSAQQHLQRSLVQAIQAIALTIEKRDPYTSGHQERVAQLAVAIAEELGLEPERIEGLRLGALIHDIGKISVPAEILNRPGTLEPEMFAIIKTHPKVGHEIVAGVEFPWPVADMVVQHHERLDGSGYPKGLKGDEILLEARILAVADVVEAMASHRPYRPALGVDAAFEALEEGRGTKFDPDVVDSCRRLYGDPELWPLA